MVTISANEIRDQSSIGSRANGVKGAGHLFYDGSVMNHVFRNFDLRLDVATRIRSNGGVYVLTEFQDSGFPAKGFEIQVNNSHTDRIRTGSLYHGYKKHHHRFLPIGLFTLGMLLLLGKQLWHQAHLLLLFPAVTAIISAHFVNFRLCRSHNHAHSDDCNH